MIKLKTNAGDRLKGIRYLLDMSQKQFAEFINIPLTRYKTVELLRSRVAEDIFASVCSQAPNLTAFLVYEGEISLNNLARSDKPIERLIPAKIDFSGIPDIEILKEKLTDDR